MKKILWILVLALLCTSLSAQKLSGTYKFAQRDTCDLYLDVYDPTPGSQTEIDGKQKPAVMFVFGGGFVGGERSNPKYLPWFKILNDNGYRLVTIDYRLGLKGVPLKFNLFHLLDAAKASKHAVDLGVEDVYSAVNFLKAHPEIGVDVNNIVLSGSSAGAMISLSSEYEICNGSERNKVLPAGFNFKGIISFAGAIMSNTGKPLYLTDPCPQLLLHGTEDGTVQYNKTQLGKWGMFGSSVVAEALKDRNANYNIYRYVGHQHDIAEHFTATWPEQCRFLEENVIGGNKRVIDCTVDDPAVTKWAAATLDSLY